MIAFSGLPTGPRRIPDKPVYVRDRDGTWRYAATGIAVPGARDLTLTERFQPKQVMTADGETIERVIVSGEDVRAAPELLGWCVKAGARVENSYGKLVEVLVPYELWQERDHVPGAIYAPEQGPKESERELALAERRCREAERDLERATKRRAKVLRRYADEMTRQRAHEITGLSVGRIQQLIRPEVPPISERRILEILEVKPDSTPAEIAAVAAKLKGLSSSKNSIRNHLAGLEKQGLVERGRGGMTRLTSMGAEALEAARAETAEA
jgi:hypothetical protein